MSSDNTKKYAVLSKFPIQNLFLAPEAESTVVVEFSPSTLILFHISVLAHSSRTQKPGCLGFLSQKKFARKYNLKRSFKKLTR